MPLLNSENELPEARRARLREAIICGCREMAEIYLAEERAWPPLEEEVERSLAASERHSALTTLVRRLLAVPRSS